jgi:phosphate starvation-inducible PhoH-like protein
MARRTGEKRLTHKQRIREIFKKPREKFLTESQKEYWDVLDKNEITLCFGPAGVGKSYIAMKKAVDLLHDENNKYEKIIIVRPAVEAEEKLGSLPGGLEEKLDPYIFPSYYLLNKIIGKDCREKLKDEGFIEVAALAYMRGWNVDNTILVFEEAQNATPAQIKLLLTRIGFNSKFFISGDLEQSDKFKDITRSGLYDAKVRLDGLNHVGIHEFGTEDIVRNPLISQILKRYD